MAAVTNTSGVHPPFQLEACPHCGANTELSTHAVYRYQCRLCGGPRIPVNRNVTRTTADVAALLKRVRKRHIARGAWKAAANTLWVLAAFVGLLGFGLSRAFDFQATGITFVSLFTLAPVVVGVLSKRASNQAARESQNALTSAWSTMASHVCASLGRKFSTEDLKAAFGVDTDSALALVAEAEVAELLDAELHSAELLNAELLNPERREVATVSNVTPRMRVADFAAVEEDPEQKQLEELRKELGHK